MKQLVLNDPGSRLTMQNGSLGGPSEHEIQVSVSAVGLNLVDALLARCGHPAWRYPHVPGIDAVGTIVTTGTKTGSLRPGQRVLWHGDIQTNGVLRESVNIPAHSVSPIPENLDDLRAAALPCSGITAWQAVERMHLKPGQTVLIEDGAGGIGFYAIQFAKHKGAKVITTASAKHHKFLGAVGADRIIDYHKHNLGEIIAQSEEQLDAILDSVGGDVSRRGMASLRHGGQFVSVQGRPDVADPDLLNRAPTIHIIGLNGVYSCNTGSSDTHSANMSHDVRITARLGDTLLSLMEEGELESPSITRIPFDAEAVSDALEQEFRGVAGKQVVTVQL